MKLSARNQIPARVTSINTVVIKVSAVILAVG
jgi:hypothetical protein